MALDAAYSQGFKIEEDEYEVLDEEFDYFTPDNFPSVRLFPLGEAGW